jgi:sugar phosphate isomerase/epimerase
MAGTMNLSRRDLGRLALAALPATLLAKPDSKWGGVQVGINVPYSYHGLPGTADDILTYTTDLGLSAVELRSQPVEAFLGAPNSSTIGTPKPKTKEEEEQQAAGAGALEKWRLAASIDGFKTFRKKYEDAGLAIQIVKFDGVDKMKDAVVDYAFEVAKALGAHALSCEIPLSKTEWLGSFATKHKLMVGYHGHTNVTSPEAFAKPESWEKAMTYSKYNGINLDLGHFTAANNTSPIPFLEKHVDRITHVHVKDRKFNNGPNVPFGEGDTPIKEVLQLMKAKKYKFQATIEYEYPLPAGSTVMKEIARCVEYCKNCLA